MGECVCAHKGPEVNLSTAHKQRLTHDAKPWVSLTGQAIQQDDKRQTITLRSLPPAVTQ